MCETLDNKNKQVDNRNENNERINNDITHNYNEAIELTGNGRYNYYQLMTCSMIQLAAATDMFAFSLVVALSSCDLDLSMQQKGFLTSMPFAGLLFAFPWGYFADQSGRRRALLMSLSVGCLFAILSAFSNTWYTLAVFKFIGSSFSTASFSLSMTYMGECVGTRYRSWYLQIMNTCNLSSEVIYFIVAYLILELSFKIPIPCLDIVFRPWRLLTLLLALPLGVTALMMICLKESPMFLADKGRTTEALDVLSHIYEVNGGTKGGYAVKSIAQSEKPEVVKETDCCGRIHSAIVPLFKPPLVMRTLQLFYLVVVLCSTNNVLIMWFPMLVNAFFLDGSDESLLEGKSFCERIVGNHSAAGNSSQGFENVEIPACNDTLSPYLLFLGSAYAAGSSVTNLLISKLSSRRRIVMLTVMTISGISCLLIDFINNKVANLIFFATIQITSVCVGIVGSYFVDLFPTSHRALVTSLGMMTARLGTFTGINLLGYVIVDHCRTTFLTWTLYVVSGLVVAFFLPSDSKEKNKNRNEPE